MFSIFATGNMISQKTNEMDHYKVSEDHLSSIMNRPQAGGKENAVQPRTLDEISGYFTANYGQIGMTTDGGETWSTVYNGDDDVTAIYFLVIF